MRFGTRDHLSPSALGTFDRCEMQFQAFRTDAIVTGGVKAPPDAVLAVKQGNHKVVLEDDLGYKILTSHNRANSELSEIYRSDMESKVLPIAREDPNLEQPAQKFVEETITYFDLILTATEPFRHETTPLEVEKDVIFDFGGVPIESRLDLVAEAGQVTWTHKDEGGGKDVTEKIARPRRIEDLKVQGQAPTIDAASKSQQGVVYAAGTGLRSFDLVAVVENKKPTVRRVVGTITEGEIERVKKQFQAAAFKIENAIKSGVFSPVNHGDKARGWICSARFCGIWKSDARDYRTGQLVGCPFGEKSQVLVSLSKGGAA